MSEPMLPFAACSETSKAAAKSMRSRAAADRDRILEFIKGKGVTGATADEVETELGMIHQTASARVSELWHKHCSIADSGNRRLTKSKREAVVFVAGVLPHAP